MKKLSVFILILSIFFSYSITAYAGAGWYFKSGKPQPVCYGGKRWITEKGVLFMGHQGDKNIYLTFDAGYGNENLEKIGEILMSTQTHAAIFVLPATVRTHGALLKSLEDAGNYICNHSYAHKNMSKMSRDEVFADLKKAEDYASGKGISLKKFFRPPEGNFSPTLIDYASELGYKTVFWSYAYKDWDNQNRPDPEKSLEAALSSLHDGAVYLLHSNSKTNADILLRFIEGAKAAGYSFGSLEELVTSQYGA